MQSDDQRHATAPTVTLDELARLAQAEVRGDPATRISGVCTLQQGRPGCIAFLANELYARYLPTTEAAAVIVAPRHADECRTPALVAVDPYLAYARVAGLFEHRPNWPWGQHPSAVVGPRARIGASVSIGPGAVISDEAEVDSGVVIGPGTFIGPGCRVGPDCRLGANVTLEQDVELGSRVVVHAGAVLGTRGFGLARDGEAWVDVPQLGRVVVGDDVEIGANTTIDRGALEDTCIGDGVKLDNQIQIGHNVRIGAHTAIAGCTGIAGSTTIGRRCMIGGHVGINGHITIGDDVAIMGMTMVTKSLLTAGVYASGLPVQPAGRWRRLVARVRRLQQLEHKVRELADRGRSNGDDS